MIIEPKKFVGLHAHSSTGSPFDGLGEPQEHIDFVLENGMDAWALTDHGNMNAFAHAHLHAKTLIAQGRNFKFIPGCEFYVHPDLAQWRIDHAAQKNNKDLKGADVTGVEDEDASKRSKFYDPVRRRHHMVVLAKSTLGLQNLFKLVTRGFKEGLYKFPRIDAKMLAEHGEGLIISTACIAGTPAWVTFKQFPAAEFEQLLPSLITDDNVDRIMNELETELDPFIQAVGRENFFLEIQFNKLGAQHLANKAIIALAKKTGIPLIATADSHYPRPELWKDRELYKKLGWLNYKEYGPDALPRSVDELKCELYPKNASQMWDTYRATTEQYDFYDDQLVCDAIERTHDIAHQMVDEISPSSKPKYHSSIPTGPDAFAELLKLAKEGLVKKNLHNDVRYIERLRLELKTIRDMQFSEYFLTMHRAMKVANKNMLSAPGRGSGAGSLVNYVLEVTNLDPIKYDLLFGRFLNIHRKGMPDVDCDVSDRDALVKLLRDEFGEESVIPVSNINTLQLKSLVKDISRFYGITFAEVNTALGGLEIIVKRAVLKKGDDKNLFQLKFDDCMKHSDKFREFMEAYPNVKTHIKTLLGQKKSTGKHAGGVIIADNVETNMPLIKVRGELLSSWVEGMARKDLEAYGILKCDFLGLGTLRIIERTIELMLQKRAKLHGRYKLMLEDKTIDAYGDSIAYLTGGVQKRVKDLTINEQVERVDV